MRSRSILAMAALGVLIGLLFGGSTLITARAQCPAGPCEPPKGDRERRPTATDTRLALSIFTPSSTETPSPTATAYRLCLELADFQKCLGNPLCKPLPPLCPSATPSPTSTPTPSLTPSPKPTIPTATGTKFMCLEYSEFQKCIGNPQCQGLPLCPWSQPPLKTATPAAPVNPEFLPYGGVPPLAFGIAGAVAMLGFAAALQRRYKDRH